MVHQNEDIHLAMFYLRLKRKEVSQVKALSLIPKENCKHFSSMGGDRLEQKLQKNQA